MELLILTLEDRNNNRGEYLPNNIIEPIKIEDDFYVLNRDLLEVEGLSAYKEAILKQPYFTMGDGSKFDLKHKIYLENNEGI